MPWASPTPPRDNSKIDAVNKKSAETTIRKYKEKGETRYIVRDLGTGQKEIKRLCGVMNSIDELINAKEDSVGEKVRAIKHNVEYALSVDFEADKQSRCYEQAQEIFNNIQTYFKRIDNAVKSSADLNLKINFAKNVYNQFDDKYGKLFKD